MGFHIFKAMLVSLVLFVATATALAQTSRPLPPLTNLGVLKLVNAGFKEKTILTIIGSRVPAFDLSAEHMIELKKNGVSEKIILAMLAQQQNASVYLEDDLWMEEPLLNSGTGGTPSPGTGTPNQGNSIDLFGSSGETRGSRKSRGGRGSLSDDTVSTGSATVRIIRPPSEANLPPKLERVPSLTNAKIIELVEAGFSEGTIIRRIQQSPVEFDLSPAKVAQLRRQRVSERILEAMKEAMGESTAPADDRR